MKRFDLPPDADPRIVPLPAGREEPSDLDEISPQLDFLYRTVDNFDRQVQFADAKAGGVILLLSIGIIDLFNHFRDFLDARDLAAAWGWLATISAIVATIFGTLAVLQVGRALIPRRRPGLSSISFFGVVSTFASPKEYSDRVWKAPERDLFNSVATAAWNLAGIATEKFRHVRFAYASALFFVVFWALARLGLSLAH